MNFSKPHFRGLAFCVALLTLAMGTPGQLPPSKGAPQVGEKAPDFTLPDTSNKPVKLSELLAESAAAKRAAKNAPVLLLIFYRGYW